MHASTPSMNATGTHGPSSAKSGFDRGQRHPVCQRHAQLLFRPTKYSERRRCLHAAVIFQSRDAFSSGSSRNVKQNQQASSGKFEDTGKRPSNEALSDPEVFGGNTLRDMPAATQRLAAAALGRLSSEGPVNWGTAGTNEDLLLNLILFGKFTTYAGCQRSTYDGVSCTSERSSLLARRAVQIQIGPIHPCPHQGWHALPFTFCCMGYYVHYVVAMFRHSVGHVCSASSVVPKRPVASSVAVMKSWVVTTELVS